MNMISTRTTLSLCQLLYLLPQHLQGLLLRKHGIDEDVRTRDRLTASVEEAQPDQIFSLLREIVRTRGVLLNEAPTRYQFQEMWKDLELCLLLDGHKVVGDELIAVDPTIEGGEPLDDDLTSLLRASDLPRTEEIIGMLDSSTAAFRRVPLDLNDCLTKARIALETTAKDIAQIRRQSYPRDFDESSWGQVLAYLKYSGLLTENEEKGLAGVYGFVSPGAHRPVESDEIEMARLGRILSIGMTYFLIKRFTEDQ